MMSKQTGTWGVGLRPTHYSDWQMQTSVPVLEIMSDNLLHHDGGPALWHTKRIVERALCCVLHGVGINLGGTEPLSRKYLDALKRLAEILKPKVISDHLCFTRANKRQSYELLPLMRTPETIEHVVRRIETIQQTLGMQFSIENVSAYVAYNYENIPEGDFINEIAKHSDCGVLLDVNNIYVSAKNFSLDPETELKRFEAEFVTQIHVAGHSMRNDFLFDTHDTEVCSDVWILLSKSLRMLSLKEKTDVPVILENDNRNTSLKHLLEELHAGYQHCNLNAKPQVGSSVNMDVKND